MATEYVEIDYTVTQGDDFVKTFGLRDSAGSDITINSGYTFKFSIVTKKKDISDGSNPNYAHADFPISATFPSSTRAKIAVSDTILSTLAVGTYYYDLQVTYPTGEIYTLQKGQFIVTDQRTKS